MDKNEYEIKRNAIKAVIQNIEKENEFCIGGNCDHCLYGYRNDKLSKEKCNELKIETYARNKTKKTRLRRWQKKLADLDKEFRGEE
jgi:hypothetical protein